MKGVKLMEYELRRASIGSPLGIRDSPVILSSNLNAKGEISSLKGERSSLGWKGLLVSCGKPFTSEEGLFILTSPSGESLESDLSTGPPPLSGDIWPAAGGSTGEVVMVVVVMVKDEEVNVKRLW
ncbi:hypothetical protein E2C01_075912 [Portunus trituberculatus]|uniref:Uncharacterized protein n=1 Tax=Portunus trituberculatus TaxID=210409 RepID=A0A5B7IH04_PORTR|nr:hypothetical protein [Portunus trituberculatus]